jgi:hypothetical protein
MPNVNSDDSHPEKAVIDAAGLLDLREVDLFRLAHREHWGREIAPQRLEALFADYMFHRAVPIWLEQFSREILRREGRQSVAIRAGARRYQPIPVYTRHGPLLVASVLAGFFVYAFWLVDLSYDRQPSAPVECTYGPGFKVLSDLAQKVHGHVPVACNTETINPTLQAPVRR